MNARFRRLALAGVLAATAVAGGCSIYATPGDVRVGVALPPVVVGPPALVVRPYYGHGYGPYGYRGPRGYWR